MHIYKKEVILGINALVHFTCTCMRMHNKLHTLVYEYFNVRIAIVKSVRFSKTLCLGDLQYFGVH